MTGDYHLMVASALRALAGAPPENILAVLALQAREIIGTCAKNDWPAADAIDALSEAAIARDIDPDAVQAALAEAATPRTNGRANGHAEARWPPAAELPFIDMSNWDTERAPERAWAVRDKIPLRQPTLFSGEGAIGKTLIALQLCVAHVTARDWLGELPEPGPAIYVGAEDEADELHRRLADIAAHYGVRFTDLIAGGLQLLSFAGQDAVLGIADKHGIVKPTALFERLYKEAVQKQPKHITLDTTSDIFVGSENDRTHVRQFVALIRRLAIDSNASVLLLAHPSLTGINTGTGLSGSTGWHNSVRARMYLRPAVTEDGDEPDPELRQLEFLKNNYGPLAQRVVLRWRNGVFVPEPGASSIERATADAKAENTFLDLLARFNAQGRNVGDKTAPPMRRAYSHRNLRRKQRTSRRRRLPTPCGGCSPPTAFISSPMASRPGGSIGWSVGLEPWGANGVPTGC
jgi:RecA-family ATPase